MYRAAVILRELGLLPIRVILEKRQICDLTKISVSDNDSLVKKVFDNIEVWKAKLNELYRKWDINKNDLESNHIKSVVKKKRKQPTQIKFWKN